MPKARQTKENHARLDPGFHFTLVPLLVFALLWALVNVFRHPGHLAAIIVALTFLVLWLALKTRIYALKVQDRVIRLEERLRLGALASDALRSRIGELNESQLIALRFAPDAERLHWPSARLPRS